MSMRRISVLLVAVVMAMMLSMGPAFAHPNDDCDWDGNGHWRHDNGNECDDNGNGGANIPRIIVHATTSWV